MFGLLALASDLPQPVVWRLMSGLVVALLLPGLIVNISAFRKFSPDELRRTGASRATFYATSSLGFAVVLLQIYNALAMAVFWPFFLSIVLSILISTLQFARLILARRE